MKLCRNVPDLPVTEMAHEPFCYLPVGHTVPTHLYRSDFDNDFAVTTKHAEQITIQNPNVLLFQKWTCSRCGRRLTMEDPNKFYTTGNCQDCGGVTDIQMVGCNFLLMAALG